MSTADTKRNASRAGETEAGDDDQPGNAAEAGNIDQIREILFGVQMEDYERRFAALEQRLTQEAADLRSSTTSRLDTLEGYVRKELQALTADLKAERRERAAAVKGVAGELSTVGGNLERKTAQIDDALGKHVEKLNVALTESLSELRGKLLEQSKTLRDELAQTRDALAATVAHETADLRSRMAERTTMAAILVDAAARLTGEHTPPEAGS